MKRTYSHGPSRLEVSPACEMADQLVYTIRQWKPGRNTSAFASIVATIENINALTPGWVELEKCSLLTDAIGYAHTAYTSDATPSKAKKAHGQLIDALNSFANACVRQVSR